MSLVDHNADPVAYLGIWVQLECGCGTLVVYSVCTSAPDVDHWYAMISHVKSRTRSSKAVPVAEHIDVRD